MKTIFFLCLLCCTVCAFSQSQWQVCFTPQEPCTSRITHLIDRAKQSIYVQAFVFTSKPIAVALLRAFHRGVKVFIIMDQSQFDCAHFSERYFFLRAGVPVWNDHALNIAHNKVMVIDRTWVETGSFNFTKMAQYHNAENVLIVQDARLAQLYLKNWHQRQRQSTRITAFRCRYAPKVASAGLGH